MEIKDKIRFITQLPLFSKLTPMEVEQMAAIAQPRRTSKFQFVYLPDEPCDYFYILLKGRLKSGTFSMEGREIIKEIMHPMAIFGDLAIAGETKRSDYAQAIYDDVEYLAINVKDFQQMMVQNQRLLFATLHHISERLQRVEDRLASLVLKDARERIIAFLIETADKEGKKIGYETLVKHRLTQQEIASLTGTSRQTVTSVFNDLRKNNIIHFSRNSILIRDVAKLA